MGRDIRPPKIFFAVVGMIEKPWGRASGAPPCAGKERGRQTGAALNLFINTISLAQ
jgi:hypothetical protein